MNKKTKRNVLLWIMTLLFSLTLTLVSCENPDETAKTCTSHVDNDGDGICDSEGCGEELPLSPNADYTINLSFYGGAPVTDVVFLYVYKGEETVHMKRIVDSSYTVNLPRDNYTFEIDSYGTYVYDTSLATFSKTKTTSDITLFDALGKGQEIYVPCKTHTILDGICTRCGEDDGSDGRYPYDAKGISKGVSFVELVKGERSYFIFTPDEGGVYKFTTVTDGTVIGNYGNPLVVQKNNISDRVNNAFTINIADNSIGDDIGGRLQMVIGIDTDTADNAIVVIERLSDAENEMEYIEMPTDAVAKKYTDLLNDKFVDIDVTRANTVVYNESDGYYHYGSETGPIVFIKITASGNSYLDSFDFPSFKEIISTGGRLCSVFYENGEIVRKESYNEMIEAYSALTGTRGLVPLDKALADAVKNAGEHMGWWSDNSIFGDNRVNTDSAWLFACAYLSENAYGYSTAPIVISPQTGVDFAVYVDGEIYMSVSPDVGTTVSLSFKNAEGATVSIDGVDYTADSYGFIDVAVSQKTVITVKLDRAGVLHFTAVSENN